MNFNLSKIKEFFHIIYYGKRDLGSQRTEDSKVHIKIKPFNISNMFLIMIKTLTY